MERVVTTGINQDLFFVLSLDGGGSKGVYSLGVLREVERLISRPLHEQFGLIYGTSTGAIITSLLALGESIDSIAKHYFKIVPDIMCHRTRHGRSQALARHAVRLFGSRRFDAFLTNVGIVSTHYEYRRPMIFKTSVQQAHGRKSTFEPGFGCTIAEAVVASCSAFPFFERASVSTSNQGRPELLDGGFVANNPTLFAIADATQALGFARDRLRILSIGVGNYPEKKGGWFASHIRRLWPFQLIETTFSANTNTIDQIRSLLFSEIKTVRIDDAFTDGQYCTNLLEANVEKLQRIRDLGRESFAKQERQVKELFTS